MKIDKFLLGMGLIISIIGAVILSAAPVEVNKYLGIVGIIVIVLGCILISMSVDNQEKNKKKGK